MDWISNGWKFCCWILYGNILYKFSFGKCKKGTREMNDYSTPYLALLKLTKDYHEATLKGQYDKAYQISLDMTDVAHDLELIAKDLAEQWG